MGSPTSAAIIAGALSTVVIYIINTYIATKGGLPEQIDQSIQALITAGVVWIAHRQSLASASNTGASK